MASWRLLTRGLRSLLRPSPVAREIDAEVEHFLDESAAEHERRGLPPEEARRVARIEMGSRVAARQEVTSSGWESVAQGFAEDFWRGVRASRRQPWFAAGTIMVLALGVGANASIWSLLHATLLRPLPYEHPDRVVAIWRAMPTIPAPNNALRSGWDNSRMSMTGGMIHAWRDGSHELFSGLAAYQGWGGNLEAQLDLVQEDRTERLRGALVTPEFFEVLGVEAAVGRTFDRGDEHAGRTDLVVLSDRLWRRAFAADPTIVGRGVRFIAGRADRGPRLFTVVGVLPRSFRFTYPLETEIWVIDPWSSVGRNAAITHNAVIARLQPGVSVTAAQDGLTNLDATVFPDRPGSDPAFRSFSRVEPITEWVVGDIRLPLWLTGSVAGLILLMTCATVANALLVRVAMRRGDLAVRAALGAARGRLTRQLIAEGAVVAVAGTVAGTLLAMALLPAMRTLLPLSIPRGDEIDVNGWWIVFAAATATASTVLAALAPAWGGARLDLSTAVKRVGPTTSADLTIVRWRRLLVGVQAAVAAVLLVGAVLLLASFWRLTHMPLGFDAERVLTVEMRTIDKRFRSHEALLAFQESVLARVRAVPGVLDAGFTSAVPFRGVDFVRNVGPVGAGRRFSGNARFVDPAYFRIMNLPLRHGRLIDAGDVAAAPRVVVISRAFALGMFGAENAVGREIDFGEPKTPQPVTVVGIVGDARYQSYGADPMPAMYIPRMQNASELACLVARVGPDAGDLDAAVLRAIREVDPTVPPMNITTVDQILAESVSDRRFYMTATVTFAVLALLLTTVGLVVVVSRAVVEGRRELALRMALGARASRLQTLVVRQHLGPVLIGTALGLAAASSATRVVASLLFQVDGRSMALYAAVAFIVVSMSAIAALIPAFSATRISPAQALKAE
jgi:putative ABC transport system permease protein